MTSRKSIFIKGILLLVVVFSVIASSGYLLRTISQNSLESDMSLVALAVARNTMNNVLTKKSKDGYLSIKPESESVVYVGRWGFIKNINVVFVDPGSLEIIPEDHGFKKIIVDVAWGKGVGKSISLYSIVSNFDNLKKISPKPLLCDKGI